MKLNQTMASARSLAAHSVVRDNRFESFAGNPEDEFHDAEDKTIRKVDILESY